MLDKIRRSAERLARWVVFRLTDDHESTTPKAGESVEERLDRITKWMQRYYEDEALPIELRLRTAISINESLQLKIKIQHKITDSTGPAADVPRADDSIYS